MRRNRVTRNAIEARLGIGAIDEIERWNDQRVDSLETHGLDVPREEEQAQLLGFSLYDAEVM